MTWKVGDWVIHDLELGQIKEIRENGCATFCDGFFETSGQILDYFRPLTLRNKRIAETFDIYEKRLRDIDGETGFNYPDIHRHFCRLALEAIDGKDEKPPHELAQKFILAARNHTPVIQGVRLFRPKIRRA